MKLIIDIPEDVYKRTVFYHEFKDLNDCVESVKAIVNGTPLDDVKPEKMKVTEKEYVCMWGLTVKVKARSEAEAKKKCADSLSNDFFTCVYPEDVEIIPENGKGE